MSQNESPNTSNFWSNSQCTFDVLPDLDLEDFELTEEPNSQNNNVQELVIPTTQTQQTPTFPLVQPTPSSLDPYPPISSNNSSTSDCSSLPIYQPHTQQVPPPMTPNYRHFYPPAYMQHPYYNPYMLPNPDYFGRIIAEEDKRRRNTAASARFRIKKKMREQHLEDTAKEMTAKAEMLENRVKELEREIKWLKDLLVEKDSRILDIRRSNNNKSDNNENTSDQQHQK